MKLTYVILKRCLALLLATALVSEASLSLYANQMGVPSPRGAFTDLLSLNTRLGVVTGSY